MHFKVVADVPHSESGGTQQQTYESGSLPEVASYILGLAREHPGRAISFTLTATEAQQ